MKRHRKSKQSKRWSNDYTDSQFLRDFESYVLSEYTLLKTLPILKGFRLGLAIKRWNREQ